MAESIGIDLGTTNTVAAYIDEFGRPQIIQDPEAHERLTPSMVAFKEDGEVLIGHPAKRIAIGNSGIQVYKRFKPEIKSNALLNKEDERTSPTNLSALVLGKIKCIAEQQFGEIETAVITTPASFMYQHRVNTRSAATQAGLHYGREVNEPTAAALYYKYENKIDDGIYYIYDYGGGTFDISCVEIKGNKVNVLSSAGDEKNGGSNFDDAIKEIIVEEFERQTSESFDELFNPNIDYENVKMVLTDSDEFTQPVFRSRGLPVNVNVRRSVFEEKIFPLVMKTEMYCKTLLESWPDFVDVLLVGGNTRVPRVRESVTKIFGKAPLTVGNPDESVALGAAVLVGILKGTLSEDKDIEFQDVANHSYGIIVFKEPGSDELVNKTIIPKDEEIPCSRTVAFELRFDGSMSVPITQSVLEETDPENVTTRFRGVFLLDPETAKKGDAIDVTYSYDESEIIHCLITHRKTGTTLEIDLSAEEEEVEDDESPE